MKEKDMGENKTIVKVEVQGRDTGAAFLAVLRTWGKSPLVSASCPSFVELIIISLQQRVGAVAEPMKKVDPICEDK